MQKLFLSADWFSGRFPRRVYKALMNSSTVITAWDGDELVGQIRALDDSEMVAFLHYCIVDPGYQGQGIASRLLEMIKVKYKNYVYIELMPDEKKNVSFYERHGFTPMPDGTAMFLVNHTDQR